MIMRAVTGLVHPPQPDSSRRTFFEGTPAMTAHQSSTSPVTYKEIARLPGYRFGSDGSVWSRWTTGRKLRPDWRLRRLFPSRLGRLNVGIVIDGRNVTCLVHRLILEAFVGPCPDGMECCHGDGNPANNDISNLRWDTRRANTADAIRHGTLNDWRGAGNPTAKLRKEDIHTIRKLCREGRTYASVGRLFGVDATTISKVNTGKSWRMILDDEQVVSPPSAQEQEVFMMASRLASLPRYWKREIGSITGLNYCDRECGCGENNQLWWLPTPDRSGIPDWVPGWMNGIDSFEIWRWLVANGKTPKKRIRNRRSR